MSAGESASSASGRIVRDEGGRIVRDEDGKAFGATLLHAAPGERSDLCVHAWSRKPKAGLFTALAPYVVTDFERHRQKQETHYAYSRIHHTQPLTLQYHYYKSPPTLDRHTSSLHAPGPT